MHSPIRAGAQNKRITNLKKCQICLKKSLLQLNLQGQGQLYASYFADIL